MEKSIKKISISSLSKIIDFTNHFPEIIELQKLVDCELLRIENLISREKNGDDKPTKALEQAVNQTITAIVEKFKIRKDILGAKENKELDENGKTPSQNFLAIDKFLFNMSNIPQDAQKDLQKQILPILQKAKQKKLEEQKSE